MKNIIDIYNEYKIMPSLQMHMLRVAAVASVICDNFAELVPKEDIVTACLLHDMGNIIKSQLEYFPQYNEPEGLMYWQSIKDDFIKRYGVDEHHATLLIMKELGIAERIIDLVNQINFSLFCVHRDGSNMSIKIVTYADGRVNPHGIVSYEDRLDEAKKRYQGRRGELPDEVRQRYIACGKDIEKQIFAKCKIKPEDITDESAASVIEILKKFMVQ